MERTIALVQGDRVVRENYAEFLRASGYRVQAFGERVPAFRAFSTAPPDLALLDVPLGVERDGGIRLCSDIRALWPRLPVAFLTAHTSEEERILGFRAGADDHIPRDASLRFLGIRLETLLARHDTLLDRPKPPSPAIVVGSLRIESRRCAAFWRETPVQLSLTYYRIVRELAIDAPQPKTAEALMRAAGICVANNTIAAHIRGIRLRFRELEPSFDKCRTERGHGYLWVP
ncbi:MAG: response regulator transcription factor [Polyangiales bacterium]